MGFVHDTGSKVFGCETRRESAILSDESDGKRHEQQLFFFHERPDSIRQTIVTHLMEQAGKLYSQGLEDQAKQYKEFAKLIKVIKLPEREVHSFEAGYEWIAALVRFATTNETMKRELANFDVPEAATAQP